MRFTEVGTLAVGVAVLLGAQVQAALKRPQVSRGFRLKELTILAVCMLASSLYADSGQNMGEPPLPDALVAPSKTSRINQDFKVAGPWSVGLDAGIWTYDTAQLSGQSWADHYLTAINNAGWSNGKAQAVTTEGLGCFGVSVNFNTGKWWSNFWDHSVGIGYRYYDIGTQDITGSGNTLTQNISIDDSRNAYMNTEYIILEDSHNFSPSHTLIFRVEGGIKQAIINDNVVVNRTGQPQEYDNEVIQGFGYHALFQVGYRFTPRRHIQRFSISVLTGWQSSDLSNFTYQSDSSNYATGIQGQQVKDLAGNPLTLSLGGFQGDVAANFIF
jgi:hypothetical protein